MAMSLKCSLPRPLSFSLTFRQKIAFDFFSKIISRSPPRPERLSKVLNNSYELLLDNVLIPFIQSVSSAESNYTPIISPSGKLSRFSIRTRPSERALNQKQRPFRNKSHDWIAISRMVDKGADNCPLTWMPRVKYEHCSRKLRDIV